MINDKRLNDNDRRYVVIPNLIGNLNTQKSYTDAALRARKAASVGQVLCERHIAQAQYGARRTSKKAVRLFATTIRE